MTTKHEMGFAATDGQTLIDTAFRDADGTWRSHCFRETQEQIQARYPGAELVNVADWYAGKGARQDAAMKGGTWDAMTQERYWEMLECVPPAAMRGGAFLVGEAMDHHAGTGRARFTLCRERDTADGGKAWETFSEPVTHAVFCELCGEAALTP